MKNITYFTSRSIFYLQKSSRKSLFGLFLTFFFLIYKKSKLQQKKNAPHKEANVHNCHLKNKAKHTHTLAISLFDNANAIIFLCFPC